MVPLAQLTVRVSGTFQSRDDGSAIDHPQCAPRRLKHLLVQKQLRRLNLCWNGTSEEERDDCSVQPLPCLPCAWQLRELSPPPPPPPGAPVCPPTAERRRALARPLSLCIAGNMSPHASRAAGFGQQSSPFSSGALPAAHTPSSRRYKGMHRVAKPVMCSGRLPAAAGPMPTRRCCCWAAARCVAALALASQPRSLVLRAGKAAAQEQAGWPGHPGRRCGPAGAPRCCRAAACSRVGCSQPAGRSL